MLYDVHVGRYIDDTDRIIRKSTYLLTYILCYKFTEYFHFPAYFFAEQNNKLLFYFSMLKDGKDVTTVPAKPKAASHAAFLVEDKSPSKGDFLCECFVIL